LRSFQHADYIGLVGAMRVSLTLTVRMRVSPEPQVIEFMKRYRYALNYAIRIIIENNVLTITKAHKLLYKVFRERFGLPSHIVVACYRETIVIAKSWLKNPRRGENLPTVKTLRMRDSTDMRTRSRVIT
jgi:predicted transposase